MEDDDWGRHGNKLLHNWDFSTLADMIEYKCLDRGVEVDRPSEHGTSSNCSNCGMPTVRIDWNAVCGNARRVAL
ncbi:zinc ribbon domain-containing protein [Haloquadratum walsbyi]|uniref:zinc ribbon domain-containing protein n=1 Tax=Haloquadratum walsbyi TaxID=293091 RepID=UPI0026F05706|nr:zinc ribbon domain-containing protein [Haloquadratum walsbyi]